MALAMIGMITVVVPGPVRRQVNHDLLYPAVTAEQDLLLVVNDDMRNFVTMVSAETDAVWSNVFQKTGRTYQKPKMVLFSGAVQSACGVIESAVGPFYCPVDRKIYLDLTFFDELQSRFGTSGDLSPSLIIAHEVGHHVQTLLDITREVADLYSRSSIEDRIRLSVMVELQADCLAGLWAHHALKKHSIFTTGDIGKGLNGTSDVHLNLIEKMTRDYIVPDDFFHGCASLRVSWFKRGLEQGRLRDCNSFSPDFTKNDDMKGTLRKLP